MPLIVLAFVSSTVAHQRVVVRLVGDEYRNFELAAGILTNHDPDSSRPTSFSSRAACEGLDPVRGLARAGRGDGLLGVNSFGWRFSSLYFAAIALAFFHRFFRTFLARRAALVTPCASAHPTTS